MKKIQIFALGGVCLFSGCAMNPINPAPVVPQPVFEAPERGIGKNIQAPIVHNTTSIKISPKKIINNSMQEKITTIDTTIATQPLFTFTLPNATMGITKREMTGFVNAENTGKITRTTVGAATVVETFYYEKGELVYVKVESGGDIKEMYLNGGKVEAYISSGKDDSQNKNVDYLRERNIQDAKTLLEQFQLQVQMNNG